MSIEVLNTKKLHPGQIKAAVFDFDGTISTLRHGWEQVMRPMMLEMIYGTGTLQPEWEQQVDSYIDSSTGIQTVYQMRWLAEQVALHNPESPKHDEWWYKDEYNRRLMENVSDRIAAIRTGKAQPEDYRIAGAFAFLQQLSQHGLRLYAASGTDHADVVKEAEILDVARFFDGISGAPERQAACSKEAVIKNLLQQEGLAGEELLLVGDGKVEISLGVECGAYTLGIASDEEKRQGVNPIKRQRLVLAGAHAITGDFLEAKALLDLLGIWAAGKEGNQ